MIGGGRREQPETGVWLEMASILTTTSDYQARLDTLLERVGRMAELPDHYLYLVDESGRRFHLERSRVRPVDDPTRAPPGPMAQSLEGGVEWSGPTAPLEMARTAEHEEPKVVATPVGRMYSVPLEFEGEPVGLLQTGPLPKGNVSGRARSLLDAARLPLAFALSRARNEHVLRSRLEAATAELEVGQQLGGSALDLDRFVHLLLELALRATGTEGGFVAILDPASGRLEVRSEVGMPEGFAGRVDLSRERGLFDWSPAAEGGGLMLRDLDAAADLGVRSILAVPLFEGSEPLGLLAILTFEGSAQFTDQSLELLESFSDQIRLMIQNSRVFADFTTRYLETLTGLARSLDLRRPHTAGHHARVTGVAVQLGTALGLADSQIEALRIAGRIHDVGMAAVAAVEGAFEADTEHPVVGASLVEQLPMHPWIAESIAGHHEWYDGWGFPRGLKGEEIPPGARVLGVAEFLVERSTSDPVTEGLSPERLAEELNQRRGSQFDAEVADAALALLREGELVLDQLDQEED